MGNLTRQSFEKPVWSAPPCRERSTAGGGLVKLWEISWDSFLNLFEELLHAATVPSLAGNSLNYGKSHETVFFKYLFEELLHAAAVPPLAGKMLNCGKYHETVFLKPVWRAPPCSWDLLNYGKSHETDFYKPVWRTPPCSERSTGDGNPYKKAAVPPLAADLLNL